LVLKKFLLFGWRQRLENLKGVKAIAREHNIPLVLDGSLIAENAFFIKQKEKGFAHKSVKQIILEMMEQIDIFYFSGRKSSCSHGGMIATNNQTLFQKMKPFLPAFEGFFTYGGMASKELEAMAVGIREMADPDVVENVVDFVQFFCEKLIEKKIPVVTPPGGLACHVDAKLFLPHIPKEQYQAAALTAAAFLVSGVRGMERGTVSMERDANGCEVFSPLELLRLAVPRRVFTMSHILFTADRMEWLLKHRQLVHGLRFVDEPPVLRFFVGQLAPVDEWPKKLVAAFKKDFGADA
jgi:tyrosine phenol-lyase